RATRSKPAFVRSYRILRIRSADRKAARPRCATDTARPRRRGDRVRREAQMKLARRKFLHLAAGTAITAGESASAQPAPPIRAKGPLVWLDMDQKELDDAYDQFVYAPNGRQIIARCHGNSQLVRERLGAPKRLAYGPTSMEALDIYLGKAANAPVNIFIHGG